MWSVQLLVIALLSSAFTQEIPDEICQLYNHRPCKCELQTVFVGQSEVTLSSDSTAGCRDVQYLIATKADHSIEANIQANLGHWDSLVVTAYPSTEPCEGYRYRRQYTTRYKGRNVVSEAVNATADNHMMIAIHNSPDHHHRWYHTTTPQTPENQGNFSYSIKLNSVERPSCMNGGRILEGEGANCFCPFPYHGKKCENKERSCH